MSACHQAHNIPWSTLHDHLHILRPSRRKKDLKGLGYKNMCTDFYGRNLPTQEKAVDHFIKKLASSIRESAEYHRTRYSEQIELNERKVIPDDILGLIPSGQQTVGWWRAHTPYLYFDGPPVLRELMFRNHVENLLFLGQQFGPDLLNSRIIREDNSHHFGTDRVYEDALALYIIINVYLLFDLYGPAPANPHPSLSPRIAHPFIYAEEKDGPWPYALIWARELAMNKLHCSDAFTNIYTSFFENGNDYLQDTERIKGFLQTLFRLLYVSDMYIRQCGGEIDWEGDIREVLRHGLNIGTQKDEKRSLRYNAWGPRPNC